MFSILSIALVYVSVSFLLKWPSGPRARFDQVKNDVQMLASGLRPYPYALETAYLGVIAFDSEAKEVVPLTELSAFQPPNLHARRGTSLGDPLSLVAESEARCREE